jgi:hypothetical protein
MCGLVGPDVILWLIDRASYKKAIDGYNAPVNRWGGTSLYIGNVTAEEPQCRMGSLGGEPKYTFDTAQGNLLPYFLELINVKIYCVYRIWYCWKIMS